MKPSAATIERQRLRLIRVCQTDGLDVRRVLRLVQGDLDTLATCDDAEVLAYARALLARDGRRAGYVPTGWTLAGHCNGCGPVWLWPEAPPQLVACPWCWNRIAALPVPSPQGPP